MTVPAAGQEDFGDHDRPLRILVAGDCAFSAEVFSRLEPDERFSVFGPTGEAADAVLQAIESRPELTLIAVELRGGGIAAAREILARLPRTRVVMHATDSGDLFAALRAGAEGYLLRDMNPERIPATLWEAGNGASVALPRRLMQEVLDRFRDPNALRRTLVDVQAEPLTSREWQILSMLRNGLSTAQVSQRLSISVATVRSHHRRIRRKLQSAGAAA